MTYRPVRSPLETARMPESLSPLGSRLTMFSKYHEILFRDKNLSIADRMGTDHHQLTRFGACHAPLETESWRTGSPPFHFINGAIMLLDHVFSVVR